jgi:type IV pilus assembly protein PilE
MAKTMKKQLGFTLIELMVVILIIGVLAAYVLPSYERNVIVSKRTEAKNKLLQIAAAQEKHNVVYNQYADDMTGAVAADNLGLPATFLDSDNYDYSMDDTDGYTITADAASGSTQVKDNFGVDCTSLTLNSLGQKTDLDCW